MTEHDEERERFRAAVDRKSEEAREASEATGAPTGGRPADERGGDQADLRSPAREQDDFSVRDKNTGHKKKTADKWNQ